MADDQLAATEISEVQTMVYVLLLHPKLLLIDYPHSDQHLGELKVAFSAFYAFATN